MIKISLRGGTKTQRNLTERASRYIIKQLLPRKRSLDLDINIRNLLIEDAAGYCLHVQKNEFEIELHNRGNLYDYVSYLAHELVHLKQYCRRHLVTRQRREFWMGEEMTGLAYSKQPWEKEAWSLQYHLAKDFIKEELNITIKESKELSPRTMKQMDWDLEHKVLTRICEVKGE